MKTNFQNNFIQALPLNELFYREIIAPIIKTHFPDIRYSAALIGWGSEILGYDDVQSTDHNWGLRFQIFTAAADYEKHSRHINQTLAENLPKEFRGHPIDFEIHVNADQRGARETARHNIDFETVEGFFRRYLDCNPYEKIEAADWFTFPEHKLLAVTSGRVFYDGTGELESIRRIFAYYPHDVWLFMLAAQWTKIYEEQAFVGRCGQTGDELGSALIAARQVKNLMQLCFLIERKYAPYSKWFGTAFSRLNCAGKLKLVFEKVIQAKDWQERQMFLAEACKTVIKLYNDLEITSPLSEDVSAHFNRPFLVVKDESVVGRLLAAITDEQIKNLKHRLGSVNQFVDSNAQLNDASLLRRLKMLYQ